MKRQAGELSLQLKLRRIPKVATFLIAITILLSLVISVYSPPSFWYKLGEISEATPSLEESTIRRPKDPEWPESNDTTKSKEILGGDEPGSQKAAQETAAAGSTTSSSIPSPSSPAQIDHSYNRTNSQNPTGTTQENYCDLFSGEWVPNPEAPYYTNATCYRIQDHQNCLKYARPDTGFLKWRWKPDGCVLPIFDPNHFLELVRGKSIAFIGDSVARNHMQSLICLLSRVLDPLDVSTGNDENQHWVYKDYNFNISIFSAPYLVRSEKTDPNDVTRPFNLYLDEFDEDWTTKVEGYDYIVISAGQWFFRPTIFYENRTLIGCLACQLDNVAHLRMNFSYERAFRTAFRAINSLANFKGVTFLRTITPSHFEGGSWDKGGDCVRTMPYKRNEAVLEDYMVEMYEIQQRELRIAQEEGSKRGLKFRLLDATQPMLLRPDGHPSKYGHWPNEKMANDCVHWCLPGPIDTWNDFLQELIEREEARKSLV
ncbi:protein trichome birefringence-like 19 [Coffea arabica]|uniref:Protein trichome birefringence-like 19 n=1 Tax=Coffea arabica TaxID=13443 RepID=A0A6P6TDR3_COFAR|nr:protein trichome birefringence-like 19 [Coffea arabica]